MDNNTVLCSTLMLNTYLEFLTNQYYSLGVSIIENGEDGVTMELEMNWDGNPNIVLDIKTRFGVGLPVQVM